MILSLVIGFMLGAAAIIFALQNTTVVALAFLGWQFQSSLALIVVLSLLVGALVTMLLSLPSAFTDRIRIYGLRKQNQQLVDALDSVQRAKTISVTETPATL